MEEITIDIAELIMDWRKLCLEIKKNQRFDLEFFNDTFTKTYSVLSQQATESAIDKNCTALAAEAYVFANSDCRATESKLLAATVLTERMLSKCAFNVSDATDSAIVYIAEVRKDVYINFKNVGEAINTLGNIFEEQYWKSI